jgi:hypothetical protein
MSTNVNLKNVKENETNNCCIIQNLVGVWFPNPETARLGDQAPYKLHRMIRTQYKKTLGREAISNFLPNVSI